MVREFAESEINVRKSILEDTPIHGELNIEGLIFRQIERTELAALQDETIFAANVRLLLSMTPSHKRSEITGRSDEYTSVSETWQYKHWCGVPLGTPDNPVNGSPYLMSEDVIDWHKLFEMIISALEECNLTWKFEVMTIEAGAVEVRESAVPTPVFASDIKGEDQEMHPETRVEDSMREPKVRMKVCALCKQRIAPHTGIVYNKKLVHIKECLDLAKVKWNSGTPESTPVLSNVEQVLNISKEDDVTDPDESDENDGEADE